MGMEDMNFELIFSELVSNESKWIAKEVEVHIECTTSEGTTSEGTTSEGTTSEGTTSEGYYYSHCCGMTLLSEFLEIIFKVMINQSVIVI